MNKYKELKQIKSYKTITHFKQSTTSSKFTSKDQPINQFFLSYWYRVQVIMKKSILHIVCTCRSGDSYDNLWIPLKIRVIFQFIQIVVILSTTVQINFLLKELSWERKQPKRQPTHFSSSEKIFNFSPQNQRSLSSTFWSH